MDTITSWAGALMPNTHQPRTHVDPMELAQLVTMMAERGYDSTRPIVVSHEAPHGKREIISGHRRYVAVLLNEMWNGEQLPSLSKLEKEIKKLIEKHDGFLGLLTELGTRFESTELEIAIADQMDELETLLEIARHNEGREDVDPLGVANMIHQAEKMGANRTKIARAFGRSSGWVKRYSDLWKMPERIKGHIAASKLPLGFASTAMKIKAAERRQALLDYIGERADENKLDVGDTLEVLNAAVKRLNDFDGYTMPLPQTLSYPKAYHHARIMAFLWAEWMADTNKARTAWNTVAALCYRSFRTQSWPVYLIAELAPQFYTPAHTTYQMGSIKWLALAEHYLPGIKCDDCPIKTALPRERLKADLALPCREGAPPGRCLEAPIDGAPFIVITPYQWRDLPGLSSTEHFNNVLASEPDLVVAWLARKEEEAKEPERDDDPVLGDDAESLTKTEAMRATIRHYMKYHIGLNCNEVMTTPCKRCRWKTRESPVKSRDDVPHCTWANRYRIIEFNVRQPTKGLGPVLPVCRQFMPADLPTVASWQVFIPSLSLVDDPDFRLPFPRQMAETMIKTLSYEAIRNYHSGSKARTVLEPWMGREPGKSEHGRDRLMFWYEEMLPEMTDGQIGYLLALVNSEWQTYHKWDEGPHLPQVYREYDAMIRTADGWAMERYEIISWKKYWQDHDLPEIPESETLTFQKELTGEAADDLLANVAAIVPDMSGVGEDTPTAEQESGENIKDGQLAEYIEAMAEKLQRQIDDKLAPDENAKTARQLAQADKRRMDARNLQSLQAAMRGIAAAWRSGIPPVLAKLKTKVAIRLMIWHDKWPEGEFQSDVRGPLLRAGVNRENFDEAKAAFMALWEPPDTKTDDEYFATEQKAKKLIGVAPGYFPTPMPLGRRMAAMLNLREDAKILEPSAGDGALCAAFLETSPIMDLTLHCCESHPDLRKFLKMQGYVVIGLDFLALPADPTYNAVLMNPPFENLADVAHVRHAYDFLKPGGVLVGLMADGPFWRDDDGRAIRFRDWFEEVGGISEKLEKGAVKAGVESRMIIIMRHD
jgi:phospholipid N-methyltransferase